MITAVREGVKLGVTVIAAATTVMAASKGSDLISKAYRSTRAKFTSKKNPAAKTEVKSKAKTATKPKAKTKKTTTIKK